MWDDIYEVDCRTVSTSSVALKANGGWGSGQ